MQESKLVDRADQVDIDNQLKKDRKKYLIRIGGLIVFNTLMFAVFIQGRGFTDNLLTSLNANLIGFNIVGFIFGTIIAAFPYKELPYSKKYLRASLLTILTLQTITAVGLLLIAIMTFLGWYPN